MSQRPLRIGLSANIYQPDPSRMAYKGRRLLFMDEGMFHWVLRRGALPFLVPTMPEQSQASVADLVSELDGLIMTGGVDLAPESYGEKPLRPEWAGDAHRDAYELALVKAAVAAQKPVLGICRGHQLLNVAFGGTLYQDVKTQHAGSHHHRIFDVYEGNHHDVVLTPGGRLAQLFGVERGRINSVHHQAVKTLGKDLVVEAVSPDDGIIEALRLDAKDGTFVMGVQWHPEFQTSQDQSLLRAEPLLDELLAAAEHRRKG